MKEVLFIMPDLPSGGAEKMLIDVLKRIDYSQYKISLLLEFNQGVYLSDLPESVELVTVHGANNHWRGRVLRMLHLFGCYSAFHSVFYRAIAVWRLKGRHFDTIVSFMEGAALKYHSYLTQMAEKNISWVHIDFARKHWSLYYFKNIKEELQAYLKMDKVIFVSREAETGFLGTFDFPEDKCRVQYNLIDKAEIVREASSIVVARERFTIVMVGRLNEQKRYDRALKAARMLKESGVDFDMWILGEGVLESGLKTMCSEMGLDDNVKFLGFKKPSYAYMAVADVFLNTSEAEGYPLTICEALCLDLPIVATDITGAREILGDSQYGLLVEETPEAIASGLMTMIADASVRQMYAAAASECSRQFDVESVMNNIYHII